MKTILGISAFLLLCAGCASQGDERVSNAPIVGVIDGRTTNGDQYLQSVRKANAEHFGEENAWVNTGKAN